MISQIQGDLLEEYIYKNVKENGWIWCKGKCVTSVDFMNPNENIYLQIKNKDNTENSSSKKVRNGTTIIKWNRLSTITSNKNVTSKTNWAKSNEIINNDLSVTQVSMSEKKYISFIEEVINKNPKILLVPKKLSLGERIFYNVFFWISIVVTLLIVIICMICFILTYLQNKA